MQGHKIRHQTQLESVEDAIYADDYEQARKLTALRLARLFDNTDCARDAKSLARTLAELIDKCAEDAERGKAENAETPLSSIVSEAETIIANA
jgi:CRISPR/Cas system CSM-associated protein Csm2 small subunit